MNWSPSHFYSLKVCNLQVKKKQMKLHKDWLSKTNLIKQVSCAPSLGFLHFFFKVQRRISAVQRIRWNKAACCWSNVTLCSINLQLLTHRPVWICKLGWQECRFSFFFLSCHCKFIIQLRDCYCTHTKLFWWWTAHFNWIRVLMSGSVHWFQHPQTH